MNLIMVNVLFDVFLSSVCEYFVEKNFCICIGQGGWTAIYLSLVAVLSSGFGAGVTNFTKGFWEGSSFP